MRKAVLVVVFLCTIFSSHSIAMANQSIQGSTKTDQHLLIWDEEYQIEREIYGLENGQVKLISKDEYQPEELEHNKFIYYPGLKVRIKTRMISTKDFIGYIEFEANEDVKLEYSLELRVDSKRNFVDLGDKPEMILARGRFEDPHARQLKISFDTRTNNKPLNWFQQISQKFRLDLKIQLNHKQNGQRSINIGIPINNLNLD